MLASIVRILGALVLLTCLGTSPVPLGWLVWLLIGLLAVTLKTDRKPAP